MPRRCVAWDMNYRGPLTFLQQARAQQDAPGLRIADGWRFFLHGWTNALAPILDVPPGDPILASILDTQRTGRPGKEGEKLRSIHHCRSYQERAERRLGIPTEAIGIRELVGAGRNASRAPAARGHPAARRHPYRPAGSCTASSAAACSTSTGTRPRAAGRGRGSSARVWRS